MIKLKAIPSRVGVGLLATLLVASTVTGCTTKSATPPGSATASNTSVKGSDELYVIPESAKHKISAEKQEAITNIKNIVNDIYATDGVVNVIVGAGADGIVGNEDDNYILQMYNDKHQCYTEASNNLVSFYYDTGKSIMASTKIEEVSDVTVLNIVEGILNLCEAGVDGTTIEVETNNVTAADLESSKETETVVLSPDEQKAANEGDTQTPADKADTKGDTIYTETVTTMTVQGFDNIRNVYAQFSQKQADDIIKSWEGMYTSSGNLVVPSEEATSEAAITQAEGQEATDTAKTEENTNQTTTEATQTADLDAQQKLEDGRKNDKLILSVYTTSEGGISVACQMEVEGEEYTSWLFDGFIPLNKSWDAGDGWKPGLSEQEYLVLMQKVQDNISAVMTEWNKENGGETPENTVPETVPESNTGTTEAQAEQETDAPTETTTAETSATETAQ